MPAPTQSAADPARETRRLFGFLLALALVFAARALQSGASLADTAAIELFVAGWILLPGWAFYAPRRAWAWCWPAVSRSRRWLSRC